MVRALSNVVVTTDSIDRVKGYYLDGLKLIPGTEQRLDPATMKRLWGLDREYSIRSLTLKRRKEDKTGFIRLVEIQGAEGKDIRQGYNPWDYGIFDFAFVVRDNEGKATSIKNMGYDIFAWPVRYDFSYYQDRPNYYVTEGVVDGPNHVEVVFIERFNAPHPYGVLDEASGFTELIHSAIMVPDMEKATDFYHNLLGIPFRGQFKNMVGPQFAHILKIPDDEPFDQHLMADPALVSGCVEILSTHKYKGKQIAEQRSLLNYGIAALSFAARDLQAVYQRMLDAKVEIVSEPIAAEIDGVGTTTAFTCYAPADIMCEVYQAV